MLYPHVIYMPSIKKRVDHLIVSQNFDRETLTHSWGDRFLHTNCTQYAQRFLGKLPKRPSDVMTHMYMMGTTDMQAPIDEIIEDAYYGDDVQPVGPSLLLSRLEEGLNPSIFKTPVTLWSLIPYLQIYRRRYCLAVHGIGNTWLPEIVEVDTVVGQTSLVYGEDTKNIFLFESLPFPKK